MFDKFDDEESAVILSYIKTKKSTASKNIHNNHNGLFQNLPNIDEPSLGHLEQRQLNANHSTIL